VLVDGASLAQTYQKKYGKKIDEKGVDGIMADMKTEIAKLHKK
jgi:ABC-type transporter MlaC component